ncbi:MAG TPA: two-component regulator propeller domain-containing protein, partial [Candidatus Kapabacteria bacterium]
MQSTRHCSILRLSFIVLAMIFGIENSQAQNNSVAFRHLGTADGLSEGRVSCMLQDSKGFLWIGTFYGLNKYDGYSFQRYIAAPQDTSGLQSNVITALCEDSSHTIWVGTRGGGLSALDRAHNTFYHYGHNTAQPHSLSSNDITSLLCDSKGRLWIGTLDDGLNYFDPAKGDFQRYSFPRSKNPLEHPNQIFSLIESRNGTIIIGAPPAPSEFDPLTGTSKPIIIKNDRHVPTSILSASLFAMDSGYLFREEKKHRRLLYYCDFPSLQHRKRWISSDLHGLINFLLPETGVGMMGKVSQYLLGTTIGLFVLNSDDHSVKPFLIDSRTNGNTYDNMFTCAHQDAQDRIWIGTYNGLYIIKNEALAFKKPEFQEQIKGSQHSSETVRSLYVNKKGTLLAGTFSGQLFDWSQADHTFHVSAGSQDRPDRTALNSIAQDDNGNTWFAASSPPFYLRPAGKVMFTKITGADRTLLPSRYFHPRMASGILPVGMSGYVVYPDGEGRVWFGSGTKNNLNAATLLCYDSRKDSAYTYCYPGSETGHSGAHGVYSILEDRSDNFWIGTADGLFLLDRTTGKFRSYLNDPANDRSLSNNAISTLYEDSRGRLWVGTWGGGLDLMDTKTGLFTHFFEKDGLSSNIIYSMLEDKDATLWIATGRGICHFNPELRTFSNYGLDDGLLDSEFQP